MWSVNASISTEYDYFSIGFVGSYTRLFNEKNTEFDINASLFIDKWKAIYPTELRPFYGGNGVNNTLFVNNITGNLNYNPQFTPFNNLGRNSYAFGLSLSQILHNNIQGSLSLDLVRQEGLLSTPFQRVYFSDVEDSFIDNFHLADAIEQLPNQRFKVAIGGHLNWYINQSITVRTFYRYYFDDWGINSNTASIELPIKITDKFTFYLHTGFTIKHQLTILDLMMLLYLRKTILPQIMICQIIPQIKLDLAAHILIFLQKLIYGNLD